MLGWPVRIDYPYDERPWATIALVAVNALVFVAALSAPEEDILPYILSTQDFQLHQLITADFLHLGVFHLFANMFFLYVFGVYAEARLGWWRFLALYAACGIAGNLVWLLGALSSGGPQYALGASGAISGLMGFTLIAAPRADVRLLWIRPGPDGDWPAIPLWFLLAGWLLFQTLLAIAGAGAGIAVSAHLGGFAAGVGLSLLFHSARLEGTPWYLERAKGGGNLEEARRERTAVKWRKIAEARREHERRQATARPAEPVRPAEDELPLSLPDWPTTSEEAGAPEAGEDSYDLPPQGSGEEEIGPAPRKNVGGRFHVEEEP